MGTGLIFVRAAACPRPWEARRLISDVWSSSFGYEGLAFELERQTQEAHTAVRAGGHDAEWAASQQGRVTSCGKRWTFPEGMCGVVALWVLLDRARSIDSSRALADAEIFG